MRAAVYIPDSAFLTTPLGRCLRMTVETAQRIQNTTAFTIISPETATLSLAGATPQVSVPRGFSPLAFLKNRFSGSLPSPAAGALNAAVVQAGADRAILPWHPEATPIASPYVLFLGDFVASYTGTSLPRALKSLASQARATITWTQAGQRATAAALDVPLDKLVIMPPAAAEAFTKQHPPFVEPPYLLMASSPEQADQTAALCRELFNQTLYAPVMIVVLGVSDLSLPQPWGDRVLCIAQCPEAQRASLLQHASACLFTPDADGVAMTLVEALAIGTAMVAPESAALRELGRDIPFYYNPDSMASLMRTLGHALSQPPTAAEQRRRSGRAIATDRSWEKSAWKLLEALRKR